MDNNSKDGTRELLESLKSEFNLTVFDDLTPDHNQSKNMTFLSHIARREGFDWVIENDADEFWFPKSGDLLTGLNRIDTVLRVERVNVLPTKQAPKEWFSSPWQAKNTLNINLEKKF
ncbi:MAG: glycosyltransferase family 2 protein [Thiomicrorhabdus sp.]|nr:glycosyltransferase family 2 protein [Thiomicrorhabdus sp.]